MYLGNNFQSKSLPLCIAIVRCCAYDTFYASFLGKTGSCRGLPSNLVTGYGCRGPGKRNRGPATPENCASIRLPRVARRRNHPAQTHVRTRMVRGSILRTATRVPRRRTSVANSIRGRAFATGRPQALGPAPSQARRCLGGGSYAMQQSAV